MMQAKQPGGIMLIVLYLSGTWMFDLMPCSYYHFDGGFRFSMVFLQTVCQDFLMYVMHRMEHKVHHKFYQFSHKPHHRFTKAAAGWKPNSTLCDEDGRVLDDPGAQALTQHDHLRT